jgi:hypothetical protein
MSLRNDLTLGLTLAGFTSQLVSCQLSAVSWKYTSVARGSVYSAITSYVNVGEPTEIGRPCASLTLTVTIPPCSFLWRNIGMAKRSPKSVGLRTETDLALKSARRPRAIPATLTSPSIPCGSGSSRASHSEPTKVRILTRGGHDWTTRCSTIE